MTDGVPRIVLSRYRCYISIQSSTCINDKYFSKSVVIETDNYHHRSLEPPINVVLDVLLELMRLSRYLTIVIASARNATHIYT